MRPVISELKRNSDKDQQRQQRKNFDTRKRIRHIQYGKISANLQRITMYSVNYKYNYLKINSENLRSTISFKRLIKGSDLSSFLYYS